MLKIYSLIAALLLTTFLLQGCGIDNGLPQDLSEHLKFGNIFVKPIRTHAPLSSRSGFIVAKYDAQLAAKIIANYKLNKISAQELNWVFTIKNSGEAINVREIWGVTGRPPQFKLKNAGQFECFYLVVTASNDMYLFAEYAYG